MIIDIIIIDIIITLGVPFRASPAGRDTLISQQR